MTSREKIPLSLNKRQLSMFNQIHFNNRFIFIKWSSNACVESYKQKGIKSLLLYGIYIHIPNYITVHFSLTLLHYENVDFLKWIELFYHSPCFNYSIAGLKKFLKLEYFYITFSLSLFNESLSYTDSQLYLEILILKC